MSDTLTLDTETSVFPMLLSELIPVTTTDSDENTSLSRIMAKLVESVVVIFFVLKPIYVISREYSPSGTYSNTKEPSSFVATPKSVPSKRIFAPLRGLPDLSLMIPLTTAKVKL